MTTISCVSVTHENGKYAGKLLNMNGVVYETVTSTLRGAMWTLTEAIEEMEDEDGNQKQAPMDRSK